MARIHETVVCTEVGPRELAAGAAYVHDTELEDQMLHTGLRIEIRDGGGNLHAATVGERVGPRWQLTIGN